MSEINQKLPKGQFNIIKPEQPMKNENLAKIEEDPYTRDIKNLQQKDSYPQKHQQAEQPGLKRPDSAKYLPQNNNRIEPMKVNNPANNINNQIKPNQQQPIIKSNNAPPNNNPSSNINNMVYQKPPIAQNNPSNNILMRNDRPASGSNSNDKKVRPSSARPENNNVANNPPSKQLVPNNYNYNNMNNNYKPISPQPLNNNIPVNNNLLIKKNDLSPKDAKQYKYESPYVKNGPVNNINVNNNYSNQKQQLISNNSNNNPQKVVIPSNIRPSSSKGENNQKVIASNNVVQSIKKVVVPEQKKIGNQIKIAENLIKGNNYNYNYQNVKNNPPQQQYAPQQAANFLRANNNHKVEPVRIANIGNKGIIKK